ncbi:hypothetical protein [Aquabacterium sp.]|uniref:hypothetical protein n=1 Tax=Aquabacterium sp. TaxID=1872578 RepID=UPI0037832CBB
MSKRPLTAALLLACMAVPTARADTVAPAVAAEQLMNYGETAFKSYFPEHQPTLSSGPFRYRAYSSKVLLGVVVTADPNYVLNGVYVMGGSFGNQPLYVGQLTQYITPTEPGPGPSGPSNGCFDLNMLTSSGNVVSVTYDLSGPTTGSLTIETAFNGLATFQGQSYNESVYRRKGTIFENGLPVAVDDGEKRYTRKTADGEITHYGTTASTMVTTNDYIATTNYTTLYSPLWVDRIYALPQGQSLTSTQATATTRVTTYSTPNIPTTTATYGSSLTETVTYIGHERVSVEAGDYDTCRYEHIDSASGNTTTNWFVAGKGVLVKSVTVKAGVAQTLAARVALLNTNPL